MKNPYLTDVFTGKTEEGKIGQFGRQVYNNALEDVNKRIKEFIEDKQKECQRNGMIKFGRFTEVSINQFYDIMDELKSYLGEQDE